MAFDGIVTRAVVKELNEDIVGGKINRIHQHEKDEILLQIRNKGTNFKLLISSSSNFPRIYLTELSKENPLSPPNFCMVLRKHLMGGRILGISQYELDRIIQIDISSIDELGQSSIKRLIVEIMGRHSNIILVNQEDNKIIDSIKKVNHDMSRVRQILPGFTYSFPPSQDKSNLLLTTKDEFLELISKEKNMPIFKFFYSNYQGLSPLISREICVQSDIDPSISIENLKPDSLEELYLNFNMFSNHVKNGEFTPIYIDDDLNNIIAFYCQDLQQFGNNNKHYNPSISATLDMVFNKKDNYDRITQKSQSIKKSIQTKLDRSQNKLGKQKDELIESQDREKYKVFADIISANIYRIPDRSDQVLLENFYDETMATITVPLDERFSPIQNAQIYYKKYSKLKSAENRLLEQIPETENEIHYLENVLLSIDNSTNTEDLKEIIDELVDEGYIKMKKQKKSKNKSSSLPHHYLSQDGFNIYVGKNNKQNEYLTLKYAHRDDIWLHVQNMPGSHVIIKKDNREVPPSTLEEAASLAVFYSKARQGTNIAVDYTERKNVRKIPNSKPGMVRYENFNTLIVNAYLEYINSIKKVEV